MVASLPSWVNLDHESMLPGSHMLMTSTAGPEATRLEAMSDFEVREEAMALLRKVYPGAPDPIAFHFTRHSADVHKRGAYSAWELGMTTAEWEVAHAPLAGGRVSFAGEAWCRTARPFTQGAFLSGIRAVDRWVLPALGLAAGPASPCDRDDAQYYRAYLAEQLSTQGAAPHQPTAWFIYPIFVASSVLIGLLLRKVGQQWRQRTAKQETETRDEDAAGVTPSKLRSSPGAAELTLMLSLAVGIEFAYYLPYALQLQVMAQFGNLNNTQFSLIDTVHNIGAVCIILVPSLADRFEVTRVLLGPALASSAGCLLSFAGAWYSSFPVFLTGWAIFGASCNALLVAQDVYLSLYFLENITLVYALQAVAHGVGTALAFGTAFLMNDLPFVSSQLLGAGVCTLVVPMAAFVHVKAHGRAKVDHGMPSSTAQEMTRPFDTDAKPAAADSNTLHLAANDAAAEAYQSGSNEAYPGVSAERMKQLLIDYTRPKYRLIYQAQRHFIWLSCALTVLSDSTIVLAFSTVAVKASLVHHGTTASLTQQYLAIAALLNIVAALGYSLVGDKYRKRCRLLVLVNIVAAVLFLCFLLPGFPPFLFFTALQLCQALTYSACWAILTLSISDEGERGFWFTVATAGQHTGLIILELVQGFFADATGSFTGAIAINAGLLLLAAALAYAMVRIDASWGVLNEDLQIRGGVASNDRSSLRHMHRNIMLEEGDPDLELVNRLSPAHADVTEENLPEQRPVLRRWASWDALITKDALKNSFENTRKRRGTTSNLLTTEVVIANTNRQQHKNIFFLARGASPSEGAEAEDETIHGKGLVASAKVYKGEVVWFDPASKPEIVDDETAAEDDLVAIADIQADPNPFNKMVHHFTVQVSDTHYEGFEGARTIEEIKIIVNNDASFFMNHSCDPNCWFSVANSSIMVARRDIEPGEEITFDYGLQESANFPWFDDGAFACGCGAKRCRGRLRPTDWMRLCDEQWYPDDAFAPYLKDKLKGRRQQVAAAIQNKAAEEEAAAKLAANMAAAEDVAVEMSNTA